MSKVEIRQDEYDKMMRDIKKLRALEAGGVDNWEWYGESLKDWFKEHEIDNLVDNFIDELEDILIESSVEEPAGIGCGYTIHYDTNRLKSALREILDKYEEVVNGED